MKLNGKVLASILTIAIMAGLIGFGTMAYFSDREEVKGASALTATIIDINVDNVDKFYLDDMMPCQTAYLVFKIHNDGDNAVDVYKHLYEFETIDKTPDDIKNDDPDNDIQRPLDKFIDYDLSVEVSLANNDWWQTIYDEDITMHNVECDWIYLGMLPAGHIMTVTQSYHMKAETGNWAQGDTMNFEVEVRGDQLKGERLLENKDGDPDWKIIHDDTYGDLTYTVRGPTFDYTFEGYGLADGDYSLIYYPDPWPGTGLIVFDSGTVSNGRLSFSGSMDCGSLPIKDDENIPGAKVWLVLQGDHDGNEMTAWQPAKYLYETGLIEYTKTP